MNHNVVMLQHILALIRPSARIVKVPEFGILSPTPKETSKSDFSVQIKTGSQENRLHIGLREIESKDESIFEQKS